MMRSFVALRTHEVLLTLAVIVAPSTILADDEIDFSRQIRPLLSNRCFNCHGPDEESRESGLRLDTFEGAVAEADSGDPAVIAGAPDESELILRIRSDEDGYRMPPEGTGEPLSEEEIKLIETWIASGAEYEGHWAFKKPVRPTVPDLGRLQWSQSAIDHLVLEKLRSRQTAPNPTADRATLARRISLDLTGLPPAPERVQEFIDDSGPDALSHYVDEILSSPAFGERWAAVWLDLARYADSQGYAQDSPRKIWRYRDWVIDAINADMPFDQFTLEQIAGDMLENPTDAQKIATAFHRNTMTNSEGGTDDEEFRVAAVVDRVNTTMQVWMGLTMGCAQCHTHKYDPLTQEEYFQFFAILNQTEDRDSPQEIPLHSEYSDGRQQEMATLKQEIAELEKALAETGPIEEFEPPKQGELMVRFVRIQHEAKQFLSLAEVQAFSGETNLALKGKATQSSTAFNGPAHLAIDGNTDGHFNNAKSTTHTSDENRPWWEVDLGTPQTLDRIAIWNRSDSASVGERLKPIRIVLLDENREPIWTQRITKAPQPSLESSVPTNWESYPKGELKQLLAYRASPEGASNPQLAKLAGLKKRLNDLKPDITTPIMKELPADKQRQTFIQVRGNFRVKGDQVEAGLPASLHPLPAGQKMDRLGLAHWLVDQENPLTSRVIVNRYWEQLFGVGLVESSEDFGTQGSLPANPELLDFLATEFVAHDWDVKWLLKEIVMSATYQQSSQATAEQRESDAANVLLARGPRFRLPAETIRDQALMAAGLLSNKMFGPSVQPPRPNLGLRAAFGGSTDWQPSPGQDRYRRGLYTSWRRTTPYPSMTTFDATSREVCTIRRIRTNTPLQALVTLNDPVFVEAAQALGRRVVAESDGDEAAAIDRIFWLVLTRSPSEQELEVASGLLKRLRLEYADRQEAAEQLATDPIGPLPPEAQAVEMAAWTVLANVLLNLDETLARP